MSSLHALMFGWEFPPHHTGGLGVACEGLVKGLLTHGVGITLVLPKSGPRSDDHLQVLSPGDPPVSLRAVESFLQSYDCPRSYRTRLHAAALPPDVHDLYGPDLGSAVERFTAGAVDLTKDVPADVIHCHDWMTYGAGMHAASYHHRPLVSHVHATELDRTDFHPNPWIMETERCGLLASDKIIAVSHYTKNMLTTHYGIPSDKIAVVHNGHDPRRRPRTTAITAQYGISSAPLVLFVGRLVVQKNPWQFLAVADQIHQVRPEVQFVMVGDGPMLPELVDRACALGLEHNIIFTGRAGRNEVDAFFARADCFVMPSLSEPFGLVALEAIGHGTPVVLSRQSGVSEVIEHGFTVDYWDTDKMADCVLTILREPALAEQLRAEAPRILRRLSWKNQAGNVEAIYRATISDCLG